MAAVIIEGEARAARTQPAPAMPDLLVAQFVLGAACHYGSKRALVDAADRAGAQLRRIGGCRAAGRRWAVGSGNPRR